VGQENDLEAIQKHDDRPGMAMLILRHNRFLKTGLNQRFLKYVIQSDIDI